MKTIKYLVRYAMKTKFYQSINYYRFNHNIYYNTDKVVFDYYKFACNT